MELAWNSLILSLVVLFSASAPVAHGPMVFTTPASFAGEWKLGGMASGYAVGQDDVHLTGAADELRITTFDVPWMRLNNDVVSTAGELPGAEQTITVKNATVDLHSCQAWGVSVFDAAADFAVHGTATIANTARPIDPWLEGSPLGPLPHPHVRALPVMESNVTIADGEGAAVLGLEQPFELEVYGFCGTIEHEDGNEAVQSGRQHRVPLTASDSVSLHRYLRLEGTSGELVLEGPMASRLVGSMIALEGTGLALLPDLEAAHPLTENGIRLPNGTWKAEGVFEFSGMKPVERGVVEGRYNGLLTHLSVDGQNVVVLSNEAVASGLSLVALVAGLAAKYAYSAALFTRLSPQQALEHPRRQTLHKYIQENPGATFRELCRATEIPAGTCRHHLSVLDRAEVIVEHRHRATVRFFENHGKFDRNWNEIVVLREPELAKIHGWLQAHEGAIQKDILEHALSTWGWSRSTTQHRLQRLVENGLVEVQEMGRRKSYSLARNEPEPVRQFGLRV